MSAAVASPLAGIRVLDLSTVVAGPFGTDILAGLGAEIIRISPPPAAASLPPRDPDQPVSDDDGFLYALQRSKRSVAIDLKSADGRRNFLGMVAQADVVYDNFRPGVTARLGIDHAALSALNPGIVTCSISGFGQTGPWAEVAAYDATVQALSGAMSITGDGTADGMPCRWGVPIGDLGGSFYAVIGILAALRERNQTGKGQALDIALFDGQLAMHSYRVPQVFGAGLELDAPEPRKGGAGTVPYGPFRCAGDEWLVIGVASNFWRPFCETLGRMDLLTDARFSTLADRQAHQTDLEMILEAEFLKADAGQWQQRLIDAGVPVGKVNTIRDAFTQPQAVARGMAAGLDGTGAVGIVTAASPIQFRGEERLGHTAPLPHGQDDAAAFVVPRQHRRKTESPLPSPDVAALAAVEGPLSGILVLELCGDEPSGTFGTQILADLGATVLKIERPPAAEAASLPAQEAGSVPAGVAYFFGLNRNKRSLCLDLKSPEGLAAFQRLARRADVVYDNQRPGVMARLGLDATALRAENPALIVCSVSGFGHTGPWSKHPAYDATIQALGGGMSLTGTGRPGAMPVRWGNPIGGIGGAFYAVTGILAALLRRTETGQGATLDIALLDAQLAMHCYRVPPALSGRVYKAEQRRGGSGALPYGPFRCGDGRWFVLAITQQFWAKASALLGHPEWADDPRFATQSARQTNEETLNTLVEGALSAATADEWQQWFVEAGIPGAKVRSIVEAFEHPHVAARNMITGFDHPIGKALKVAGSPIKLSSHAFEGFRHAPALGEDSKDALARIAGYSAGEFQALLDRGVTWWPRGRPVYARPSVV